MPPMVVKTGSAFISNGLGRFINTYVRKVRWPAATSFGVIIGRSYMSREADGLMPSAQLCATANVPGESTHPQIWIRTGIGSRFGQTRRTSKRISVSFPFSLPVPRYPIRDTVAVLVLNCCQLV
jgi:hypothetical protein